MGHLYAKITASQKLAHGKAIFKQIVRDFARETKVKQSKLYKNLVKS